MLLCNNQCLNLDYSDQWPTLGMLKKHSPVNKLSCTFRIQPTPHRVNANVANVGKRVSQSYMHVSYFRVNYGLTTQRVVKS